MKLEDEDDRGGSRSEAGEDERREPVTESWGERWEHEACSDGEILQMFE